MTRKELYRRKLAAVKAEYLERTRALNAAARAYHRTLQEMKRIRSRYEALK